jgi:hypothetical protein
MSAPYYIICLGSRGPRKPHLTIESARAEAARLFEHFKGLETVRIMETVEDLDAVNIIIGKSSELRPRVTFKRKREIDRAAA